MLLGVPASFWGQFISFFLVYPHKSWNKMTSSSSSSSSPRHLRREVWFVRNFQIRSTFKKLHCSPRVSYIVPEDNFTLLWRRTPKKHTFIPTSSKGCCFKHAGRKVFFSTPSLFFAPRKEDPGRTVIRDVVLFSWCVILGEVMISSFATSAFLGVSWAFVVIAVFHVHHCLVSRR